MSSFWNEKKVFVTGATGLVGYWLIKELLSRGAQVVALIRDLDPQSELIRCGAIRSLNVVNGSLEDYSCLERALNEYEIDTVFHLGAQTIVGTALRSPLPTFEANIRGSYHLLDACRRLSPMVKRIVIASSDKAYGSNPCLPYVEDMPLEGRHPYDVSKSCTDLIALSYFHTYKLPIAISRCGNIYGGGDLNWSRIIPGTIRSLLSGETPLIRSDGKFTRDYVYVKDIVNAYLLLAQGLESENIQGEAFNFAPNRPYSVLEIVETLQQLMQCAHLKPKVLNSARAEIRDQSLSAAKAEQVLGWTPSFTLEEGLQETIDWYTAYLEKENCFA